jgi:hypothetical protein
MLDSVSEILSEELLTLELLMLSYCCPLHLRHTASLHAVVADVTGMEESDWGACNNQG